MSRQPIWLIGTESLMEIYNKSSVCSGTAKWTIMA
jgi:hypothetical protein